MLNFKVKGSWLVGQHVIFKHETNIWICIAKIFGNSVVLFFMYAIVL